MLEYIEIIKGGPGSGNWGHAGRPGMVGGSASRDQSSGDAAQGGGVGRRLRDVVSKIGKKIDEVIAGLKEKYKDVSRRVTRLGRLRGVMKRAADWMGKMFENGEGRRQLGFLLRRVQMIGKSKQLLWSLTSRVGGVMHQPRSRELHVDPGEHGAKVLQVGRGGNDYVYALEDANGKRAVYKLALGEADGFSRTIPAGTGVAREVAVSRIADILGLTGKAEGYSGWRVPRSDFIGDGVEGNVTEWVENAEQKSVEWGEEDEGLDLDSVPEKTLREISLFDMLIGNIDRHAGNLMRDTDGNVVAIEHGLSLGDGTRDGLNREPWEHVVLGMAEDMPVRQGGKWDVSDTERGMAQKLLDHKDELYKIAEETDVPRGSIDGMLERAEIVVGSETWRDLVGGMMNWHREQNIAMDERRERAKNRG